MLTHLHLGRTDVVEAEGLISRFGITAGIEAAERAEASRNIGNHIEFCRWRQIERLIILLSTEDSFGTVH